MVLFFWQNIWTFWQPWIKVYFVQKTDVQNTRFENNDDENKFLNRETQSLDMIKKLIYLNRKHILTFSVCLSLGDCISFL